MRAVAIVHILLMFLTDVTAVPADRAGTVFALLVVHLFDRQSAIFAIERMSVRIYFGAIPAEFTDTIAGAHMQHLALIAYPVVFAFYVVVLRFIDMRTAVFALLIMFCTVRIPNVPNFMLQRFRFFCLPLCMAILAFIRSDTAVFTACCVADFLPDMRFFLFVSAVVLACDDVYLGIFFARVLKHMRRGIANILSAVPADQRAGSVLLIDILLVILRVRTGILQAAALADLFCYTVRCNSLQIVVRFFGPAPAAVVGHAVADRVSAPLSISDIPAIGQRIAQRQCISRL